MKKRLLLVVVALLCAIGIPLYAQTTTVTASHLKMAGADITVGLVLMTPVDVHGTARAFSDGSGNQNGPTAFECNIVAGAITTKVQPDGTSSGSCTVPDATQTTPANILYAIEVRNTSTGLSTSGKSYTLQQVVGVSGSTWALDHYGPPSQTTNVQPVQASIGTTVPGSCVSPSVFTKTGDHTFWSCVGGVFVEVSGVGDGDGDGDVSAEGIATAIQAQNGCTGDGPWFPHANKCSTSIPAIEVRYLAAAVCDGGAASSAGLLRYDSQQPQAGCIASASSAAASMAFQAAASPPQYATATVPTPPYWTGTDMVITFKGTATTGNVTWMVETGCTNANGDLSSVTYGTPISVTTTVSGTANGVVNSAATANIAVPATNGCTASASGPSSLVTLRIHRSASDTQAGDAHLLGITLTTKRSQ